MVSHVFKKSRAVALCVTGGGACRGNRRTGMRELVLLAAILLGLILFLMVFGRGRFTKNLRISFYILVRRVTEFVKRFTRRNGNGNSY